MRLSRSVVPVKSSSAPGVLNGSKLADPEPVCEGSITEGPTRHIQTSYNLKTKVCVQQNDYIYIKFF